MESKNDMTETEIIADANGMKTILIHYQGPIADWSELFRNAAARYGLSVNVDGVRFVAVPLE